MRREDKLAMLFYTLHVRSDVAVALQRPGPLTTRRLVAWQELIEPNKLTVIFVATKHHVELVKVDRRQAPGGDKEPTGDIGRMPGAVGNAVGARH